MRSRFRASLLPEEERRLMEQYEISFDGPLLPRDWPVQYKEIFEKIRQIVRETYDDYGKDGRLDHRLTVLPNIPQIKRRACELLREAHRCRRQRVNEATWRLSIEHFIISQFRAEVICRKCRRRFWEADFQATQTQWAAADQDLRERRARRLPCTCSNDDRMPTDVYDPGSSLLFTDRSQTAVLYHSEDQLIENGIQQRQPDRIFGLEHTNILRQLLPNSQVLRHSPFSDGHVSYPFLIIEAKSEKDGPGFESVERQTAFPIRTLLKLQKDLQAVRNMPIDPLVWFMANQGDEWRVYACIVDGTKYRVIDLWHGCMLSLDNALQILLIADYICDWARDIFRPNILRCLSGRYDIMRDETPFSSYQGDSNFSFPTTAPTYDQNTSPLGGLNSITRRTYSLSLEPVLDGSINAASDGFTSENFDGHIDAALNENNHQYLRFSGTGDGLPPWRKNATIRHSDMVLFSFHIFSIPEDPSHITKVLESISSETGLNVPTTCSRLLDLLENEQSVTVSMNAIYQLENMWTGREHPLTSLGDYPVRASVLFHTYLREDWQIVREIHCVVVSRFALISLMRMANSVSSAMNSAILPEIFIGTEGMRSLRNFSGSDSIASALSMAYLRVGVDRGHDVTNPSSWVSRPLNQRGSCLGLERKLALKQVSNPTSLKLEVIQHGFEVPRELKICYDSTGKMDETGAILIKKPLSWGPDSPDFCLMILDDTPFTDLNELRRKLYRTCEARNIYMTGAEKLNGKHVDKTEILRLIDILQKKLLEDASWSLT